MRIDFTTHHKAAQLEDLLFLLDAGVDRDEACRRVGVASWEAMEKRVYRARPDLDPGERLEAAS